MARTPRRRTEDDELLIDPLEGAQIADQIGVAGDLTDAFEVLRAYDQNTIKGVLFRKPPNGIGKFEWIEDIGWPFDMSAILANLKAHWGGGAYRLQVLAGSPQKTRKVMEFSIADDGKAKVQTGGRDDMFLAMMNMQQENSRQMQAASDRQMTMLVTMMTNSSQQMVAMMTAMMGNREKAADFLPLLTAMKSDHPQSSMKETVETLAALKTLLPNGEASGGFDFDNLAESALKFAGPAMGALGKAFERRGGGTTPGTGQTVALEVGESGSLHLTPPAGPPGSRVDAPEALPAPQNDMPPLLRMIGPDIGYYFARRKAIPVDVAAGCIYDVILAAEVPEDQFNELAAAFAVSPDWLADLAAHGLDLRADPPWAQGLLRALVAIHTDPDAFEGGDDPERQVGDEDDASGNGQASAGRLAVHEGSGNGGWTDDGRVPERSGA